MNQFLSALEPGSLRFPGLTPGYGKIARLGRMLGILVKSVPARALLAVRPLQSVFFQALLGGVRSILK